MGAQPMSSHDSFGCLIYNGEIYNYEEIREELLLRGAEFRGTSDSEVLIEAIRSWGVESALQRCVGMFAFGYYDKRERILWLARDRMGEKPLYYGWCGSDFVFGSELKALKAHPEWRPEIDRSALQAYFRYSSIPAPLTIYKGIRKLMPGTILKLNLAELPVGALPEPWPYWSILAKLEEGQEQIFQGSEQDAADELERLLKQAVQGQMIADVPLGAFLSGGVDSSTIVALMQAQSIQKVKTFTIGFSEQSFDEAIYARNIAKRLGTDHTELYVTTGDVQKAIARLPSIYDEPFADSSQIPTLLVAQLARGHVTVSLSGDGGDELFGGYARYQIALSVWSRFGWLPRAVRTKISKFITAVPIARWDQGIGSLAGLLAGGEWGARTGDRLYKLADILDRPSLGELSHAIGIKHQNILSRLPMERFAEVELARTVREDLGRIHDNLTKLTYMDMVSYLPDDILTKVDRATMSCSLEGRMPLLDHRVVEFSGCLPTTFKMRDNQGKWLLRQVLYRYLSPQLFQREKKGFAVPLAHWLRGPLHEWAENLLSPARITRDGILNASLVAQYWTEHQSGARSRHNELWDILMFQAWLDTQ
jgi:asparagine synthase (glutamine-hydrolysing)